VSRTELQRVARDSSPPAAFNVFNVSDGMGSEYCVEGYQPSALRDHTGRLWFGTDYGVVTVDPARLRLNTNPPPVVIQSLAFTDRSGNRVTLKPAAGDLVIPPGATDLEFNFDGLSYTAPEKVNFKYRLAGTSQGWTAIGNDRELRFRDLPPGTYALHLAAANNDGVWNEKGATLLFVMQPYVWQTLWFRFMALLAVAGGGGFTVWRLTRRHFQQRIEQLQQQRRFEQERARHATIMENTSDLVVFADSQGGVLHINPSGRKLIGRTDDENLHDLKLAQLQPVAAAEKVAREGIPTAREHGTWETETTLLHRDGHEIPVSLVLIVHKDADGHDSFISAIARDITGRKQTEAELQRREKYFRWLIEHASDGITVINPQGVATYQSSSGQRILGYPPEAILGRNLFELTHPEDLPKARAGVEQALVRPDVPVTLVARLRHHDGSWRTIQVVGTSSQTESGEKQIVLNSRDLTENLQLEAQLRQAQKMEAVGQLAGGVAHDFNNILTSLRLQAELLGMNDHLPDGMRDGLQQICADTHRAAGLTRQLLLFSRRQVMQLRALDLNQVVMNLAKMLQRIIREDIRLQLNLHATPLMTQADAGMLDQVLINLAVNARDAMTKGGWLRIETTEAIVGPNDTRVNPDAKPGRYVCVSVKDSGGGIPPEVLPRIFEPFFTTKEAGRGSGLGLATVFGIVKQHQGWIKLDNRPGEGVTFYVYLPASTAPPAPPAGVHPKPKPRGGSETILLVEDEWAVRMSTRLVLERHGYKVLEAVDAQEALKLWQEHRKTVALLLTDMVMPGELGGRELGRRLVLDRPALKVIFASGYSADIAGRDFQLHPGQAFMQKPFVTEQLLELVRHCLDN
jgi:PAS domain S-box-containing protein